jgi:hypothetical protein
MSMTEAGSASATLDRPSTVSNVVRVRRWGEPTIKHMRPANMKKVSVASAFTGLELSMGSQSRCECVGQPLLDDD